MNTQGNIEEIEAREKAATRIADITARHQEFEGWCVTCLQGEDAGSVPWPCDAAVLLAQLKDREEKLVAAVDRDSLLSKGIRFLLM